MSYLWRQLTISWIVFLKESKEVYDRGEEYLNGNWISQWIHCPTKLKVFKLTHQLIKFNCPRQFYFYILNCFHFEFLIALLNISQWQLVWIVNKKKRLKQLNALCDHNIIKKRNLMGELEFCYIRCPDVKSNFNNTMLHL